MQNRVWGLPLPYQDGTAQTGHASLLAGEAGPICSLDAPDTPGSPVVCRYFSELLPATGDAAARRIDLARLREGMATLSLALLARSDAAAGLGAVGCARIPAIWRTDAAASAPALLAQLQLPPTLDSASAAMLLQPLWLQAAWRLLHLLGSGDAPWRPLSLRRMQAFGTSQHLPQQLWLHLLRRDLPDRTERCHDLFFYDHDGKPHPQNRLASPRLSDEVPVLAVS